MKKICLITGVSRPTGKLGNIEIYKKENRLLSPSNQRLQHVHHIIVPYHGYGRVYCRQENLEALLVLPAVFRNPD
jgi:hypothetical protein